MLWNELSKYRISGKITDKTKSWFLVVPYNVLEFQGMEGKPLFFRVKITDVDEINSKKQGDQKITHGSIVSFQIDEKTKCEALSGYQGIFGLINHNTLTRVGEAMAADFRRKLDEDGLKSRQEMPKTIKQTSPDVPKINTKSEDNKVTQELRQVISDLKQQIEKINQEKADIQKLETIRREEFEERSRSLDLRVATFDEREKVFEAAEYLRESQYQKKSEKLKNDIKKFKDLGGPKLVQDLMDADEPVSTTPRIKPDLNSISKLSIVLNDCGLAHDLSMVRRIMFSYFCASRLGQIILYAGPPGAGKTSTAMIMPRLLGMGVSLIPVRPGWLDAIDILGYFDPRNQKFIPGPFTDALMKAELYERASTAYTIILDEMNIAKIENYGADILSRLEKAIQGEKDSDIYLYSADERLEILQRYSEGNVEHKDVAKRAMKVPANFNIPQNLIVSGTLNHDSTTYPLSPKVKDRSLFLKIPSQDLKLDSKLNLDPTTIFNFEVPSDTTGREEINADISSLWGELVAKLRPLNCPDVHLSHRSAQVVSLIPEFCQIYATAPLELFDDAVCLKILPWIEFYKDDGASIDAARELQKVLEDLGCEKSASEVDEMILSGNVVSYLK